MTYEKQTRSLGVTGGIAIYKTLDLIRSLKDVVLPWKW